MMFHAHIGIVLLVALVTQARAAEPDGAGPEGTAAPVRPEINWIYRSMENWSVLADPALRTDPFDPIKYIPLAADPKTYLSLGLTVRERYESLSFSLPPVLRPDDYLLSRVQLHADLHLGSYVRIFAQVIDARAPWKNQVGPVDQDRLDLAQAFVDITVPVGAGTLVFTVGRHDPFFDLQRFAAIREGPNVPGPFDSIAAAYTLEHWQVVAFYSQPVDTIDEHPFDDYSNNHFTLSGARLVRSNVGPGTLSLLGAQLRNDDARYLAVAGTERRNVLDLRYAGRAAGWDWDVEGMAQGGSIGGTSIRAWGGGVLFGYTFAPLPWRPRLGLQFDAASGNRDPNGDTLRTFNPLFPNGFYEMLSGYPGYANFVHLRPSVMVRPAKPLSMVFNVGLLWRETTADAVYLLPAIPVPGTAGRGSAYSGSYAQIRLDWEIARHLVGAVDVEQFWQSQSLRDAGATDGHYLGVQIEFGI